jgi:hypothetical protein
MKAKKIKLPDDVKRFFQRTGAEGGKSRARKHTASELSAWGKLGGRPRKGGK